MDTRGRSSSKRKPLADCTNTIPTAPRRNFWPSAAKSSVGVTAPPKPSKRKPPTSSSSHKTNTSTGSNHPPIVDSALSIPHTSDPPAPPTPLSDSGGKIRRKFGPSAAQLQWDEKIMKEKGNISSETPIIQASKLVTHQALLKSSSVASGNYRLSQKSAVQIQDGNVVRGALNTMITKNSTPHVPPKSSSAESGNGHFLGSPAIPKKLDAEMMKDKGKMVSRSPNIETTDLFRPPHVPLASSSTASDNCYLSVPSAVQDHKLDAQGRKDKGKMVLETPIIEITDRSESHVPLASSSAASDNWHSSDPPVIQDQILNAQKRKDKGKMVLETPIIEITDVMGPHMSLASSSAAVSYGSPAVQNQKVDAQTRKDKGKTALEIRNIETTNLLISHMSPASSSAAFSNYNLSGPSAVQNRRLDKQERIGKEKQVLETQNIETNGLRRLKVPPTSSSAASGSHCLLGLSMNQKVDAAKSKGKGKMVQETIDIEVADPSTPQAPMSASSGTSGTCDQERPVFLTVYNQRRSSRRRTRANGKSIALSCPPNKRTKNMGMELGDDCGKKKSGSHSDPLPMHKKSRNKKRDDPVHIMPQDEIEKLNAYYAEIDAFELPEEAASDSD